MVSFLAGTGPAITKEMEMMNDTLKHIERKSVQLDMELGTNGEISFEMDGDIRPDLIELPALKGQTTRVRSLPSVMRGPAMRSYWDRHDIYIRTEFSGDITKVKVILASC
jgi:hypothetical protein